MGLFKEFKEFAVKGNMIDMAVGIIIGTAFNKVLNVLVQQIIMPPLSMMTAGINYADRKYILREATPALDGNPKIEEIAIGYGLLIETVIDFLVIGFTIFLVVKFMNRFRRKADDPNNKEVAPARNVQLLENINKLMEEQNDLLKKK